jgi:hypothetical protein
MPQDEVTIQTRNLGCLLEYAESNRLAFLRATAFTKQLKNTAKPQQHSYVEVNQRRKHKATMHQLKIPASVQIEYKMKMLG